MQDEEYAVAGLLSEVKNATNSRGHCCVVCQERRNATRNRCRRNYKETRRNDAGMLSVNRFLRRIVVPLAVLFVIGVFSDVAAVGANHYRGGTITWKPSDDYTPSNRKVTFTYRLSWTRSHATCDNNTIAESGLIGARDTRWVCMSGCMGTIGSTRVHCTGFDEDYDWSTGENTVDFVFQEDSVFEISLMRCCWADTINSNNAEFALSTKLLLGERSDTQQTNHAPVVSSPLAITLEPGVLSIIQLDVSDEDGDNVTCRLGTNFLECGHVCNLPADFSLDQQNCRITYSPSERVHGNFALTIIAEDYHRQNFITVGERRIGQEQPLSYVAFQFIVQVGKLEPKNCTGVLPELTLDVERNHLNTLRAGRRFSLDIQVQLCNFTDRVSEVILTGPEGIVKGNTVNVGGGLVQSEVSWTPAEEQTGRHRICIIAQSSSGLQSEEKCISVFVEETQSFCRGVGGMQYITFDGYQYSFSGGCRYQLAITTFDPLKMVGRNVQPFNITIQNDMNLGDDGRPRVSMVHVTMAMRNIELRRSKRVVVDGVRVFLPVRYRGFNIDHSGKYVLLTSDSGVTIRYDGLSAFIIALPAQYRGLVEGLCGDNNDDPNNDLTSPKRKSAGPLSAQQYGNSFLVAGERCIQPPLRDEPACSGAQRALNSFACAVIKNGQGCFKECHPLINPEPFYENCINAMCNTAFSLTTMEAQIGSYADACQMEGAKVCEWRKQIGASLECPPNSHYNACGPLEQRTCASLDSSQPAEAKCVEGCVCNDGFVLSGDYCVPQKRCGCFVGGSYRMPGFRYRTGNCTFNCRCVGQNKTECSEAPPCGDNERCGPGSNGLVQCLTRLPAPATCKAIGDPHYQTFDGATFDSMSTCAHVLVKSRESSSVTPFTVVAINAQPRPNNTVSHVSEVQIRVDGEVPFNVTFTQGPVIKYNGEVVLPGTSLPMVQFRRSSHFIVATFNFGLVVRWDGLDRLRLSAWSTLKNQVEGLCGNYDGDPVNDFVGAGAGGLISDVDQFVNSWRVTGVDLEGNYFPEPPRNATELCFRHGFFGHLMQKCVNYTKENIGSCRDRLTGALATPCDDPTKLDAHRKSCFILIDPFGPFAPCHTTFNPFVVYNDCLFDLCAYEGNQTYKERILESYDYDCREKKIPATAWRNSSDTPLECGPQSEYSLCMSQCQPTCADPDTTGCSSEPDLGEQCVEGCQCLEGFVKSESGDCIPRENCGCIINGRYQLQGFTYRRNNCTEECVCSGDNVVECSTVPKCKINLKCEEDGAGYQTCAGRLRRRATCKAVTDPHYKTFDNIAFDSMGTCAYIMVQNRAGTSAPNFRVVAVNENPVPGYRISHVKEVHVHFGNKTMIFRKGPSVTLDGVEILPGTEMLGFVVRTAGNFIVVDFDFRIVVRWDGQDRLRVTAWQPLRNMVEGLCGNFDDDGSNDFRTSWGQITNDLTTFVRSWEIPGYGTEGCVLPPPANASDVCVDEHAVAVYGDECSGILDPNGPFAECHSVVSPVESFRDCVYDLCAYNGSTEMMSRIVETYSAECLEAGIPPERRWRDIFNISTECKANQHYDPQATECPSTCTDPDGSKCLGSPNTDENNTLVDGCVCNAGFILSGNDCVPVSDCGCIIDGRYHQKGFVYRNRGCDTECTCLGGNNVTCYDAPPCPVRSKCKLDSDGFKRCVKRLRRRATCKAVTDPHYMTFDGTAYDSMGMCSYIMVRNKANYTRAEFTVVAVNQQPEAHRIVSHVKEVYVHFAGNTMRFMQGPVVQLNGVTVNPGYKRDGIVVRKAGRFTVVDWDFGLMVRWDGDDRLRISAWSPLRYQVEGLCGNFDDNNSNDLTAPNGTIISNINSFVNSWIIEGYGAEGCPEGLKSDIVPPPCTDKDILESHRNACYIIIDPNGPMKDCQSIIEAESAFQACVYDQCAYGGAPDQKDRLISSYITSCLDEDEEENDGNTTVKVPEWRPVDNITNPECPPHSHFVTCLPQCQPTCDDPFGEICRSNPHTTNECVEGCEANVGYVLSGDRFVKLNHCGCMYEGKYYLDSERFMTDGCKSRCTCSETVVTCTDVTCGDDRECRANRNGHLDCLPLRKETCKMWGNGHIRTFDKRSYDLKTPCSYILAASARAGDAGGVIVETVRGANDTLTKISTVTITFAGFNETVVLKRVGDSVQITVNGVVYDKKWKEVNNMNQRMVARHRGRFVVVVTSKGHRVEFDGVQLLLKLPVTYFGLIHGICGNFNGDPSDDMSTIGKNITTDVEAFAASYRTKDCDTPIVHNICTDDQLTMWRQTDQCAVISDIHGPLGPCNTVLRTSVTRRYEEQCVQDLCDTSGANLVLQQTLDSFSYECLSGGIQICDWRQNLNTTYDLCPPNTHYQGCGPACPPTCGNIPDVDDDDCTFAEYCACNDGYVLKDGECMPVEACGCQANGRMWSYGESYTPDGCEHTCTCYGDGKIRCENTTGCLESEICALVRTGNYTCVRKPRRRVSCKVVNGLRYRTFDDTSYRAQTTCAYTMVRSILNAKDVEPFSVVVMQQRMDTHAHRSTITEIKVIYDGGRHELVMKPGVVVRIDGLLVIAGTSLHGVAITHVGEYLVAAFDFGLVIRWNGHRVLRIDAWRQLHSKVEGLCGDFDDLPLNDFVLQDGTISDDVASFFNDWKVTDHNNTGCHDRVKGLEPPPCPTHDDLATARTRCNILLDREGPFEDCHQHVDPHQAYNDCVFDSCASDLDSTEENRVMEAYAQDCREESGDVVKWRNDVEDRVLDCPAHSFYNNCMSQCQPMCSDRGATSCQAITLLGEECVEGCQCIDGYVRDGKECIPMQECGCLAPGDIYIPANGTGYINSCSKMCDCIMGILTCSSSSCYDDQYCGIRDDVHGCHWIDECEYNNGGCSHTCEMEGNTTVCNCPNGYTMSDDDKTCNLPEASVDIFCEDGQTEEQRYSTWRERAIREWMMKLEKYMVLVQNNANGATISSMCGSQWTPWLDRDDPGGLGDEETFVQLRREYPHLLCANPVAIESRMADGRPSTMSGNNVTISAEEGLICINKHQPDGRRCGDFQVRFLCLDPVF